NHHLLSLTTRRSSDLSKSIFDIIAIDTDNCNSTGNHRYRCIIMLNIQKCNVVDSITMETLDNRITSKLLKISIVKIGSSSGVGRSEEHTSELQSRFDL